MERPQPPADPALLLAQAQIEIMREKASAEITIKRDMVRADVEIVVHGGDSRRDRNRSELLIALKKNSTGGKVRADSTQHSWLIDTLQPTRLLGAYGRWRAGQVPQRYRDL